MISLVSLLVAAALVSQQYGFEANANALIGERKLNDQNLPNVKAPRKQHRLRKFVIFWTPPEDEVKRVAGARTTLLCEALGNPPPAIYWTRNGETVEDPSEEENEVFPEPPLNTVAKLTSTLVITSAIAGEDEYSCIAEGGGKRVIASSTVYTVPADDEEENLLSLEQLLIPPAPIITYYYENLLQTMDSVVVLPCRVHHSYSKAQIYWLDNNKRPVKENPRMKVLPSGDLLISSLQWSDMGNFTCLAKNAYGSDEIGTFLYPAEKSNVK